jgi:hypothetical protein
MRVKATAFAEGAGGRGRAVAPIFWLVAVVGVVAAFAFLFGQIRDTVTLADPAVRAAQAQAQIAEVNHRTAELQRDTANLKAQHNAEAPWTPWTVGAERLALVALLGGVAVAVVLALVAAALMVRRHLSLPTPDGRVPLVGLDRELSAEALFRYQELQARRTGYEVLPPPRRLRGGESDEAEGWEGDPSLTEGQSATALDPQQTEGSAPEALTRSSRYAAPPLRSGPGG